MTAAPRSDFWEYLRSTVDRYEKWWKIDALTTTIANRQATFTFEQQVQTEEKPTGEADPQQGRNPRTIQFPLISGIQTYAKVEPVLVVGSPGVGKTSALLRCLLEYAKQELLKPEHEQRIPVLIRLKNYDGKVVSADDRSGLLGMIQDALDPELCLELADIKRLLFQEKRLILLLDGLNEMSSDAVRTGLINFREKCVRASVPLICSTRELGSGDLRITRKLIIQPPAPQEIDRFLDECIPAESRRKVEDLLNQDRRELSRTPFVLWMLYHVVQETGNVAVTLGGAFRQFFQSFKCRLEAAPVPENRRQEWDAWLKHLAFAMFSSPDPLDPGLTISEADANTLLLQAFPALPESPALSELLKYHLLQQENNKISFQHQLVQEYYAAEALVDRVESQLEDKKIPDDEFKHYYLNYLKWTEPIALMLSLLEEKNDREALQIVQWALDIDLMLGARLAGAVRSGLQGRSIRLVVQLQVCILLRIQLLGETRAEASLVELYQYMEYSIPSIRKEASEALGRIGSSQGVFALVKALKDSNHDVRWRAADALQKIRSKKVIPHLLALLDHPDFDIRRRSIELLGEIGSEQEVGLLLLKAIEDPDFVVRSSAAEALGRLRVKQAIPALLNAAQDAEIIVQLSAVNALNRINPENFLWLDKVIHHSISSLYPETTLKKIKSERSIAELFVMLQSPNFRWRREAAKALGKIVTEQSMIALLSAINDPHYKVRKAVCNSLEKIGNPQSIEQLWKRQIVYPEWSTERAISKIQNCCQFYNYAIYKQSQVMREQAEQKTEDLLHDQLNHIKEKLEIMTDGSKYNFPNAQKVQIFEKVETYHEHNYAAQPDKSKAVAEMHQLLESLERQYPIVTEAEAKNIIEAEIVSIQTCEPQRWQMLRKELLNRERWFNGGKAALVEATQTLADKLWLNVLVAFLDGFSADV